MIKKNFSMLASEISNTDELRRLNFILNKLSGKTKLISITKLKQVRFINVSVNGEDIEITLSNNGYLPVLSMKQFLTLRKNELILTKAKLEKVLKSIKLELKKIEGE